MALFVILTVPDHFLDQHLWNHIARKHIPRVFGWTLGSLAILELMLRSIDVHAVVSGSPLLVLLGSALIGLVPESGPHLVFVTLYGKAVIPFSILLTSSIVQDGHGMLPLLAQSRQYH